jgi:hypothetical protein
MKAKFAEWGIDLQWVSLFPHIDDFNGRDPGQNFLGSVSRTVEDDTHPTAPEGYVTKRRLTMTFCQRKVHEDTVIREACVGEIHDRMRRWSRSLPEHHNDGDIKQFARHTHKARTAKLMYRNTHRNKCMYYSILSSDQRHIADHFQLGLYHQVKALACLVHCNGPDKHHSFFQDLLTLKTFPSDVIVLEFIRFSNASNGGLVMSLGKAIRHRAH